MNKIQLIGNVGREPELTYTPSGSAVAKFSLAVSYRKKDKDKDETTWFNITAWDRLAETVSQYVKKGSKIYLEGRLMPVRVYTGKDGSPQASLDVTMNDLELLTPRTTGEGVSESESA